MCIVLVARTKKYSFILSNRDEFLARPTLRANWWPAPNSHVLSGRDLARSTHGTWLGITRQGRIVALTNYREETEAEANAATISRGEITNEFLLSEKPFEEWIQEVLKSGVYKNVGGFSLMCGILRKDTNGYAVVSNRSCLESGGADYILSKEDEYECEGLSNALLHVDWPKVKIGKELLEKLVTEDIQDEEKLIEKCFELLSTNLFTEAPTMETLQKSIFIPRFAAPALSPTSENHTNEIGEWNASNHPRWYGTHEQTVILVSREDGRVVYTERTLWDDNAQAISKKEGQVREEFHIEGWNDGV